MYNPVLISPTTKTQRQPANRTKSRTISVASNSLLRLSGLSRDDRVMVYSMDGKLLYKTTNVPTLRLEGMSHQLLLVRIMRSGAAALSKIIAVQ
jgi:hypothetical protein